MPTRFSRAMEEPGIQMIFALSPQAKGGVERTAGTFQNRLATELRLAGASGLGEANRVLEQCSEVIYNQLLNVRGPGLAYRNRGATSCANRRADVSNNSGDMVPPTFGSMMMPDSPRRSRHSSSRWATKSGVP